MNSNQLTPERSLEIITQTINEAKMKFEEDGLVYVFWGILISVAAFSQFFLLRSEYYEISYYPWFLMPLGGIFSWWYYSKKNRGKRNKVSDMISISWMTFMINVLLLGFVCAPILETKLIPLILILIGMGTIISGRILRSNIIFVAGLLVNITGFVCFKVDWQYQPLVMGIASILGFLIPGLLLMRNYKKLKNT